MDLGPGDEEHAVLEPAPAAVDEVPRRAVVVGEQDRVDAGLLRVGEHLGEGAAGVVRVFGVGVEDAAVIGEPGAGRDFDAPRPELLDIGVGGRQAFEREPFEVGVLARRGLGGRPGGREERPHQHANQAAGKRFHTRSRCQ